MQSRTSDHTTRPIPHGTGCELHLTSEHRKNRFTRKLKTPHTKTCLTDSLTTSNAKYVVCVIFLYRSSDCNNVNVRVIIFVLNISPNRLVSVILLSYFTK